MEERGRGRIGAEEELNGRRAAAAAALAFCVGSRGICLSFGDGRRRRRRTDTGVPRGKWYRDPTSRPDPFFPRPKTGPDIMERIQRNSATGRALEII